MRGRFLLPGTIAVGLFWWMEHCDWVRTKMETIINLLFLRIDIDRLHYPPPRWKDLELNDMTLWERSTQL